MMGASPRDTAEFYRLRMLLAEQLTAYCPSKWSLGLLTAVSAAVGMEMDHVDSLNGPAAPVLELVKR